LKLTHFEPWCVNKGFIAFIQYDIITIIISNFI